MTSECVSFMITSHYSSNENRWEEAREKNGWKGKYDNKKKGEKKAESNHHFRLLFITLNLIPVLLKLIDENNVPID